MTAVALPTWDDQMDALKGLADRLIEAWRPDGATEAEAQEMNQYVLSALASGYFCHVYTDPARPVFMPLWNYACPQGGPNPDYVYASMRVDPQGVYRISGNRGTTRFVEITQQEQDLPQTSLERPTTPPLRTTNDLDELSIGSDGRFSVTVSAQRPEGHTGDWWPLDPRSRRLLMRKCSSDWKNETDASVAVNRLDQPPTDPTPAQMAQRFSDLATWVEGRILHEIRLVRYYLEHHGINVLLRSKWIEQAGGLAKQAYYDGIHQIGDDEALIVEFPVPARCHYWQILVADDRFVTVDWVNRQSSLNDSQARIDDDGVFRAVISRSDPGVHNWLDKSHYPWGIIQARFYQASEFPDATVTKVAVGEVRDHLPAATPTLTAAQRAEQLSARREAAQLRRIW